MWRKCEGVRSTQWIADVNTFRESVACFAFEIVEGAASLRLAEMLPGIISAGAVEPGRVVGIHGD